MEGDVVDLSELDAIKGGRDNDFHFIGTKSFHGKARELRFVRKENALVAKADVDGDARADLAIRIKGVETLSEADFVL